MRVRCPHCSQPIELVPELESKSIVCPSCGSEIGLVGADEPTATLTFGEAPILEHFELIEDVGMGQFGRVWKARDLELRRVVAVKVPHKRNLSSQESGFFLREARSAAKLNHPNIVSVYEVGITDGSMYIVSEFIDGPTMRLWRELRKPSPEEGARVCMATALALDYAHEQRIVHRDLKPSNIILDDLGEPHITDFGLAKQEGAEATIAITGHVIGTPAYMAPEQIRDGHQAERRSDVYSLGVILYELITGERPFKGGRRILFQQVLYDDPQPPRAINPNIPKDLQTICLKAIAKKPADRYETAAEFAEDLRRFLADETIKARPTPVAVRAARWARRRPAVVSSALLLLLVLFLVPLAFKPNPPPAVAPKPGIRGPIVQITTEPPGAEIVLVPIHEKTGEPQPNLAISAGRSPVQRKFEPGTYLVVAYNEDRTMFHEVYRHVPIDPRETPSPFPPKMWVTDDKMVVHLRTIQLFSHEDLQRKMARVQGGSFVGKKLGFLNRGTYTIPGFLVDETEASYEMAANFGIDLSGRMQELQVDDARFPIVDLRWQYALLLAEKMGKRLLTNAEYDYLETAGGTQRDRSFWDPTLPYDTDRVDHSKWDRLEWKRVSQPIIGLRSHVLEWTDTWVRSDGSDLQPTRIVRGGINGRRTPLLIPPPPIVRPWTPGNSTTGFRCARSLKPRTQPDDFIRFQSVSPTTRQKRPHSHDRSSK